MVPEQLGVGVGQPSAGDVAPVVGVAADVGDADARVAQRLELVVAADGREPDPVVDLRDLAQRRRVVLRDEQHAAGEGEHHDAAAARDPLAGQLRPVAQELVDGGVERHRHGAAPGCAGEERGGGTDRSAAGARGAAGHDGRGDLVDVGVRVAHRAVAGDRHHHRVDVADEVRAAGGGVVVGGVVERLDGGADRAVQVGGGVVQLLERDCGRTPSRSRRRGSPASPRSGRRWRRR